MSLSATLFGRDSLIFKATNVLGLGIPGWLDKKFGIKGPEAQSQAIGELSQQTAKESEPRAIIWGRVRPIGGNLIHCQTPVLRWITTYSDSPSAGKGGGKKSQQQETRTQHVYRTYAIGVCEGPITAFARIWRNNKLVYDGRGTDWGAQNNGVFLGAYRLYLGPWSQMPSPDLEAVWGAGNVPAYRGTAYMVAINEDLTDQGGAVPQWLFEVERAEGYVMTSKPYAAEDVERVAAAGPSVRPAPAAVIVDLVEMTGPAVTSAAMRTLLHSYTETEAIGVEGASLTSGSMRTILQSYTGPPEAVSASGPSLSAGTLQVKIIDYRRYPLESVGVTGAELLNGSLA
ncbi:hypothetical protein HX866_11485 [Pseudomonas gingeri]|uniref:hypothetical protein n=1 Tax=Pseudomonas gingeri TaxID=117681 RepID=UPI0015A2ABB8|nr:hypothetical protein [Pseudomonas gingeri]NWA25518.1 hypothetical protein [Pseudomonas gingeri]